MKTIDYLLERWRQAKKDLEDAKNRVLHLEELIRQERKKKNEPE